jgi:hypothetical protein
LPDDVRARLAIAAGERILAWGELRDGGWAAATPGAIHVDATPDAPDAAAAPDAVDSAERLDAADSAANQPLCRPWCDVDRASFDPKHGTITLRWVDGSAPMTARPIEPARSRLPQVVRERVEWSVVLSEAIDLPGGRAARVAVRRTLDGPMFSQALAGPGVDLDDPAVAPVVDAAERRLRAQAGLRDD